MQIARGVNGLGGFRLGLGRILCGDVTGLAVVLDGIPAIFQTSGLNRGSLLENAQLLAGFIRCCTNVEICRGVNGLGLCRRCCFGVLDILLIYIAILVLIGQMIPVAFHSQLFRLCILRQNAQNGGRVIRLCSHIYIGGCANACSECTAACHHSRQCARNQAHHDFFRFHGNPSLRSVLTVFLVSLCIQCSIFVCYLQQHAYNSSTTKRLHILRYFLRNKKSSPCALHGLPHAVEVWGMIKTQHAELGMI